MTIGSLFSGIGGFELGLERAGLGPVLWQVEINPFCRDVLAKHWPNAERFSDVQQVSGRHAETCDLDGYCEGCRPGILRRVDIICGGFPCQDLSVAGHGAGLDGARSGLWREFARIVGEVRPRVVAIENVAALVGRGLDRVVSDLVRLGYEVEATRIRASDVGAPHRRERLFALAYARGAGLEGSDERGSKQSGAARRGAHVADPDGVAVRVEPERDLPGQAIGRDAVAVDACGGRGRAAEPRVGRGAHGVSDRLDGGAELARWPVRIGETPHAWEPPRSTRALIRDHDERLAGLGNAIVPECAEVVGRRIRART